LKKIRHEYTIVEVNIEVKKYFFNSILAIFYILL